MDNSIKYALILALGIGFIVMAFLNVYPAITNTSVTNSSMAFAANNTYYALANRPIYTSAPYIPTLAYANGTALSNYSITSTQARIGSNIAAGTYYISYTYYSQPWVGGTNYAWVIGMFIFIAIVAVALRLLGII